jgi:putative endonuclease
VLGARGEDLAVAHLTAAGLVVLDRNWRCRAGELDVVATDGATLVVVEVKTRSGDGFGTPAESVTPRKLARLRRLAQLWLAEHRVGWVEVRFDVVAVLARPGCAPEVEHLRGVF